jgi:hypothetical protein
MEKVKYRVSAAFSNLPVFILFYIPLKVGHGRKSANERGWIYEEDVRKSY